MDNWERRHWHWHLSSSGAMKEYYWSVGDTEFQMNKSSIKYEEQCMKNMQHKRTRPIEHIWSHKTLTKMVLEGIEEGKRMGRHTCYTYNRLCIMFTVWHEEEGCANQSMDQLLRKWYHKNEYTVLIITRKSNKCFI